MGSPVQMSHLQKVEYVGELKGQTFVGYYKNTEGTPATTLLDMVEKKTVMYFSDDLSELHVMEQYTSRSPTFYALKSTT